MDFVRYYEESRPVPVIATPGRTSLLLFSNGSMSFQDPQASNVCRLTVRVYDFRRLTLFPLTIPFRAFGIWSAVTCAQRPTMEILVPTTNALPSTT